MGDVDDLWQKGLLTVKDVAKIMQWSENVTWKRIHRHLLPGAVYLKDRLYIKTPVLRAWLEHDDETPKAPR